MTNTKLAVAALAAALAVPATASAHHGRGEFFNGEMREIEGEVVEILWRSPHVMISVKSVAEDGTETLWQLEGSDAGTLERRGLTGEQLNVGDRIKAAGRVSNRRDTWLSTSHVLLPNGTEMIFGRTGSPRWTDNYIGGNKRPDAVAETAPVDGIFRVWMRDIGTPYDVEESPPLTPEALAAYEAYDPLQDDPVLDCVIPGMPRVMTVVGSRPIEFEQDGDNILLHSENYNQTRIIYMGEAAAGIRAAPSPLGHSSGRWEGDTLVVTTTGVTWPYFDLPPYIGIPQSSEVEIVERFTLNEDADELTYDFWAFDPVNFTAPIAEEGFMVWGYQPDVALKTDACEEYVDVP